MYAGVGGKTKQNVKINVNHNDFITDAPLYILILQVFVFSIESPICIQSSISVALCNEERGLV